MAEVIWTEPALDQLDAILEFIALDKPDSARAVAKRIFEATDKVQSFEKLGKSVPELRHPNYRQIWLKPCWIYYKITKDEIYILHVRRSERPLRIEELLGE